jgi:hypothetical protein
MPRPAMTSAGRIAQVTQAYADLPVAITTANRTMALHGPSDPRTLSAWMNVEALGATIHRQSRLLAGKSKGG